MKFFGFGDVTTKDFQKLLRIDFKNSHLKTGFLKLNYLREDEVPSIISL